MPLVLPPFGRGGSGGGHQLPPRLQHANHQEAEGACSPHKRPPSCPPPHAAPGGRGIRVNWNRQPPPSLTHGPPREARCPDQIPEDPAPTRKPERMSTKLSGRGDHSGTNGELSPPSGCPLSGTALPPMPSLITSPHTVSVPPPSTSAMTSLPTGPPPSPYLFPPPPSSAVSQTVPFCPYLVVPHVDHSVPVNVNAVSSSDPSGADLPINDTPTLRFFYNLGLEYYRLCMLFQLQQQQQYAAAFIGNHQVAAAAGPLPPPEGAMYVTDLEDMHGTSRDKDLRNDLPKDSAKSKVEPKAEQVCEKQAVPNKGDDVQSETRTAESQPLKEKAPGDMEIDSNRKDSDSSSQCEDAAVDSGCASDISSGTEGFLATEECCDANLVPCIYNDNHSDNSDSHSNPPNDSQSDSSSQHSTSNLSVLSSSGSESGSGLVYQKPYYVPLRSRTTPKLLKPLKDIPPRFQKILSCNPAIRQEQFEGQPIMRQPFHHQHRPKSVIVSANNINELPTHHSFNPYAETFIPRQPGPCDQANPSSANPSLTNPSSYASSSVVAYNCQGEAVPSECCSSAGDEAGCNGTAKMAAAIPKHIWVSPPTANSQATSSTVAPTYTIHIHSSGCTIEPSPAGCAVANHCVSASSSSASSSGCYAVTNALPAPPAGPPASNSSYEAAGSNSGVVAPVPPPGGIVYYCQQQQQHPDTYNQNYSTAPYPLPGPGGPHYVYGTPPSYQAYENYTYAA